MDYSTQGKFRETFRNVIEHGLLSEADALLREVIIRHGDPVLGILIGADESAFRIDCWSAVATAMANASAGLVDGPEGAMILSLVHRGPADDDMRVLVRFSKTAEEAAFKTPTKPGSMLPSEYVQWVNRVRSYTRLPIRPHFGPIRMEPKPRLLGLNAVYRIYTYQAQAGPGYASRAELRDTAMMLAGALVFLRFCQAAERQLQEGGASPRLPAFLTVERAAHPYETGTVDWCDHATRFVAAGSM